MVWFIFLCCTAVCTGMMTTAQAQRGAVRFEQTQFKNMSAFYTYNEMQGRATMVTTDSMLHTAHILFDYTLRAAELRYFDTNINLLASGMMARLSTQAQEESTRDILWNRHHMVIYALPRILALRYTC